MFIPLEPSVIEWSHEMRLKHVLLALAMAIVLGLCNPRTHAQVITGGYVGFGSPGLVYSSPLVAPAPIVPYASGYPVVVPRPLIGPGPFRSGWGYGPRFYGPRRVFPGYRFGYGRRWW
jgi:hypothetical protein